MCEVEDKSTVCASTAAMGDNNSEAARKQNSRPIGRLNANCLADIDYTYEPEANQYA